MGRKAIPKLSDECKEIRRPRDLTHPRHPYYRNRASLIAQLKLLNKFALKEGWSKEKLLQQSLAVQRMFQARAMDDAVKQFKMASSRQQRKKVLEAREAINDKFSSQQTQHAIDKKFEEIEAEKARQRIKEDKRKPGRIIIP